MVNKNLKDLAKEAAQQIEEYIQARTKIAQAPPWLKSYMESEYPQGAGRADEPEMRPALEDGQIMYVKPDLSNLQGIAMSSGANTLAEFLAAHLEDAAKAKALAAAAHADLAANWAKIEAAKGAGKAAVIKDAFEEVFAKYGLGAFASSSTKLSKLATKLQKKYMR